MGSNEFDARSAEFEVLDSFEARGSKRKIFKSP